MKMGNDGSFVVDEEKEEKSKSFLEQAIGGDRPLARFYYFLKKGTIRGENTSCDVLESDKRRYGVFK
jgi:hypothetical protein